MAKKLIHERSPADIEEIMIEFMWELSIKSGPLETARVLNKLVDTYMAELAAFAEDERVLITGDE